MNNVNARNIWPVYLFVLLLLTGGPASAQPSGRDLIGKSLEAMGGRDKLENIRTLRLRTVGHRYGLEQSERPEGPMLVTYENEMLSLDFREDRYRSDREMLFIRSEEWRELGTVVDGGDGMRVAGDRMVPGGRAAVETLEEERQLLPDRALLAADRSEEVAYLGNTLLQDIEHHVVGFTAGDRDYRLYLNAYTYLPTALEQEKPSYVDIWGGVRYRTYYSFWFMEPGGISYPYQFDTWHEDQLLETRLVAGVEINPSLEDSLFAIPDETRKASEAMAASFDWRTQPLGGGQEPREIAPEVVMLPGSWNTTVVRQEDGLVIIEAPISSEYSAKVIAEATARFPGVPVKAAISTSDAWPHLGGVREYVAREVPVYAHRLNRNIIERLVDAEYSARPDSLEKAPVSPRIVGIDGRTVLGSGRNRIELYPIRGEGSERMVMAWLPELKLLYGSDLIQMSQDGTTFWNPQYVTELARAVEREGLDVEQAFAMHAEPMEWKAVLNQLEKQTGRDFSR